jgi:hypothetical protein
MLAHLIGERECGVGTKMRFLFVDVGGGSVKFGPVRILQTDPEIQPWPKCGAAVAAGC